MSLVSNLQTAFTRVGTEFKTVYGKLGDLTSLTTTSKTTLVGAINEVAAAMGGAGATIDDTTASSETVYSSSKTDSQISAAVNGLVDGAPGTLNTLKEIADALGDDSDVAATLTGLINAKANDDAVVKLTDDQTVAGVKTFSSSPVVPDASFTIAKTSGLQSALDAKIASTLVGDTTTDFAAGFVTALS
jgi:hypothetical protein